MAIVCLLVSRWYWLIGELSKIKLTWPNNYKWSLELAHLPGNRVRLLASNKLDIFYGEGQLTDLKTALERSIPPIVLVHTNELPYWQQAAAHTIVLLVINDTTVVVNDPGLSQEAIQISVGDFELAWDEMANLYALLIKI